MTTPVDFDISQYTLPEELKSASFIPINKPKTVGKSKVSNRRANFMITINPNISPLSINANLEKRQIEYAKLQRVNERIRDALKQSRFVVPNHWDKVDEATWRKPRLISFEWKTQLSEEKKWLHTHAIARFDGLCKLDVNPIRDYIREDKQYGFQKFNLQCRFVPDSMQNAEDYINRDEAEVKFKEDNKGTLTQILRELPIPKVRVVPH